MRIVLLGSGSVHLPPWRLQAVSASLAAAIVWSGWICALHAAEEMDPVPANQQARERDLFIETVLPSVCERVSVLCKTVRVECAVKKETVSSCTIFDAETNARIARLDNLAVVFAVRAERVKFEFSKEEWLGANPDARQFLQNQSIHFYRALMQQVRSHNSIWLRVSIDATGQISGFALFEPGLEFGPVVPLTPEQKAAAEQAVSQFNSEDFDAREAGEAAVVKLGRGAVSVLEAAKLKNDDPETVLRIDRAVRKIQKRLADGETQTAGTQARKLLYPKLRGRSFLVPINAEKLNTLFENEPAPREMDPEPGE